MIIDVLSSLQHLWRENRCLGSPRTHQQAQSLSHLKHRFWWHFHTLDFAEVFLVQPLTVPVSAQGNVDFLWYLEALTGLSELRFSDFDLLCTLFSQLLRIGS